MREVEAAEFVPLRQCRKGVRAGDGSVGFGANFDVGDDERRVHAGGGEILLDGGGVHPRIIDRQVRALVEQVPADLYSGGLASVVGVLFESETEDGDALAVDRVKKRADDFLDEAALLPVVKMDHLPPVFGDVREVEGVA